MRSFIVFILVALFACGGLLLVGCKKKEEVPTAATGEITAETAELPTAEVPGETAATGGTAGTAEEAPTAEAPAEEGGQ